MKLPEDIQEKLEEFWAEEYESDYQHLFEKEEKEPAKVLLYSEEMEVLQSAEIESGNLKF